MKGLNPEELQMMTSIASGWAPRRHGAVTDRLRRRGLIADAKINCGALFCPGHLTFDITSVGRMVLNVVRSL